ncbi:MAG: hypothetical protein ABL911_03995 [Gallionella sp.]|nr:hypothetical protein [Gallionella sp.]
MALIVRKNRLSHLCFAAAILATLLTTSANAGMFDMIDNLSKKIAEGSAAAEAEVDAKFAEEMRKEMPVYSFDIPAPDQSGQYVKMKDGDTLEDVKKVGIVNFSVEFVVENEATAVGSQQSKSKVRGIPDQDTAKMQAMVEQLYTKTVSDLGAMGIEIVPFETIKATKNYGDLAEVLHASPWETETKGNVDVANGGGSGGAKSKSIFVSPAGIGILSSIGSGMFGPNIPLKIVKIGYDLNREVVLLSVNMVVDFSVMQTSGRSLLNVAKIKTADIHHLQADNTYFKFQSARGVAPTLTLKKAVVSDKPLFSEAKNFKAEIESGITSTETSTTSDKSFYADTYYARSGEMLEAARQMFIAELKKAK